MKSLIVTAAGLSTRFEGLKPKWMLTHPSGRWMIVEALKNLDFDSVDKVYLGFLQEHIEKYNCRDAIDLCIKELEIEDKAEVILLSERTDNQPHTVYEVIKKADICAYFGIPEPVGSNSSKNSRTAAKTTKVASPLNNAHTCDGIRILVILSANSQKSIIPPEGPIPPSGITSKG